MSLEIELASDPPADVEMEAEGGVGGFAGMKNDGIQATLAMIAVYRTQLGTSDGDVAQNGEINWPKAAPKGFASDATAVADVRPAGLNQTLE